MTIEQTWDIARDNPRKKVARSVRDDTFPVRSRRERERHTHFAVTFCDYLPILFLQSAETPVRSETRRARDASGVAEIEGHRSTGRIRKSGSSYAVSSAFDLYTAYFAYHDDVT